MAVIETLKQPRLSSVGSKRARHTSWCLHWENSSLAEVTHCQVSTQVWCARPAPSIHRVQWCSTADETWLDGVLSNAGVQVFAVAMSAGHILLRTHICSGA